MTREEELLSLIGNVPEAKEEFIKSLVVSFVEWEKISNELIGVPVYEIDKANPLRQRKLPAYELKREADTKKVEIARAILREINLDNLQGESDLIKALKSFE